MCSKHAQRWNSNSLLRPTEILTSHAPTVSNVNGELLPAFACYACMPSIASLVAFRAMLYLRAMNTPLVDPPSEMPISVNAVVEPAGYIRQMALESNIFEQKLRVEILSVGFLADLLFSYLFSTFRRST